VFLSDDRHRSTEGATRAHSRRTPRQGITEQQRRRWVELLQHTADEVDLPDDPEFRSAFVGYLEWGTPRAVIFSRPGATPNPSEPMAT
jgi:truncated hemoglobin YjbI